MSCTSPLTVAMTILPLALDVAAGVDQRASSRPRCRAAGGPPPASSRAPTSPPAAGTSCPAPNRSPTMFMPSISGPSITCSGRPPSARIACAGLLGVLDDEVGDAVHQRVRQPLARTGCSACRARRAAPSSLAAPLARSAISTRRSPASLPAVQHHVLDALAQLGLEVVVDADHAGVDDAHVHAGLDRVVQEHGVDRLAHRVVAAEARSYTLRDAAARPWRRGRFCLIQRVASMKSTA